jgi:Protein of unknown function (DUF2905)
MNHSKAPRYPVIVSMRYNASMFSLPKVLIGIGLLLVAVGALVWLLGKVGIQLGRLPGDIVIERENMRFYFPWVTCLVVSLLLSLAARFVKL